jgi:adenylate cyclase
MIDSPKANRPAAQDASLVLPWKQAFKEWRGILLGGPVTALVILLIRATGLLQPLEWFLLDRFFTLRPPEPIDPRITIIGQTENDIARYNSPLSDDTLADLLEKLLAANPRVIGLDFYRNVAVAPGTDRLEALFAKEEKIFGITKRIADLSGTPVDPHPILADKGRIGSNDIPIDADGIARRGLFFLVDPETGASTFSLAANLAWTYLLAEPGVNPNEQVNPDAYLQLGQRKYFKLSPNTGGYIRADTGGYQLIINYRGPAGSFEMLSVSDILSNQFDPDLIRDRIILIGPFADSLNDTFETPYSSMPLGSLIASPERMFGVELQAQIASQFISSALDNRPAIQVWPDWAEAVWIAAWTIAGSVIFWRVRFQRWTLAAPIGLAIGVAATGFAVFLSGLWIPVAPVWLGLATMSIVMTGYIARNERQDRKIMMHLFGRHVTPQVAEEIWRQRERIMAEGRLVGQRATATVLFTDIKNFSTIAEDLDPEPLMEWLNEYMEGMAEVVLDHGGTIDKFIGDAVMAVFGVPILRETDAEIAADATDAVSCAIAMGRRLAVLNQKWQTTGQPIISMRAGIATGPLVVGSLGSSQREDYTIIGDSVNVAARLEGYEKSIEGGICRILIDETAYNYIQGKFATKMLGSALLKGRGKPVMIYQVEDRALDESIEA